MPILAMVRKNYFFGGTVFCEFYIKNRGVFYACFLHNVHISTLFVNIITDWYNFITFILQYFLHFIYKCGL